MPISEATTEGIRVSVLSEYVSLRSDPLQQHYFFIYHITIRNDGDRAAHLYARHWIITDGEGKVEEVRGPGVVGHTPKLEPGSSFEYTSACSLSTPVGSMRGTYRMMRDDGEEFDAKIAAFTLAMPYAIN